jgi:hypothetical protein
MALYMRKRQGHGSLIAQKARANALDDNGRGMLNKQEEPP